MRPLMLALVPLSAGCGGVARSCYDMYAPDMLTLELRGTPRDGDWELALEADGEVRRCAGLVMDGEWGTPQCDDGLAMSRPAGVVTWVGAPEQVDVTLWSMGEALVEEAVLPQYTVEEPNGRGCGTRERATEAIELY